MKTRICHLPRVGDEVSGNIHGTEPRSVLVPSHLESAHKKFTRPSLKHSYSSAPVTGTGSMYTTDWRINELLPGDSLYQHAWVA